MLVRVVQDKKYLNDVEQTYCVLNSISMIDELNPIAFIEENNKVLGTCLMTAGYHDLFLESLKVIEKYRSKGIGTQLFRGIKKWAIENKFETISLTTYSNNLAKYLYYREGMYLIHGKDGLEDYQLLAMGQYLNPKIKLMSALLDLATEKVEKNEAKTIRHALSKIGSEKDIVDLLEYAEPQAISNSHNEESKKEFETQLKKQYQKFESDCTKLLGDKKGLLYTCADIIQTLRECGYQDIQMFGLNNIKSTVKEKGNDDLHFRLKGLTSRQENICESVLGCYSSIKLDRNLFSKEK